MRLLQSKVAQRQKLCLLFRFILVGQMTWALLPNPTLKLSKESALPISRFWQLLARWLHSLSTVLAQDHFYSDFLSLLLTNQIHFESVHSLNVLTSVKLMIECAVHLLGSM